MPTETTPGSKPMANDNNNTNPAAAAVFDNVFQRDTTIASQDNVPPSTEAASLDQKPAAAVKPPSQTTTTTIKRVFKSSFNFKSNINSSSTDNNTHPCGILHASKTSNNIEQHTFGWINNISNPNTTNNVSDYLNKYGYKTSSYKFIPYTTKESWITKYPQCNINFDVDTNGVVVGNTDWEVEQMTDQNKKSMLSSKKKPPRGKAQPKLLPSSILPNKQRSELHLEIYNYFNWLHSQLQTMESTNHSGRRQVSNAGINVLSLKGMIGKMEHAFKILQDMKDTGGESLAMKDNVADMAMNNNGGDGMNVDDIQLPKQKKTLPYLETALEYELNTRASLLSTSSTTSSTTTTKKQYTETKISWRTLSFDILYQKLVDFKNEKGHVSPPFKHPELGRWVSELRANKKMLREKGLEFEQPLMPQDGTTPTATTTAAVGKTEEETPPTEETGQQPPKKKQKREKKRSIPPTSNTYLSQDRVQQLDSIKFIWSIITNRASWDERFEELKQFKVSNGRWPTTKEGTIGNWLKNQRKLFSKEDVDFMTNKKPKVSVSVIYAQMYILYVYLSKYAHRPALSHNYANI